ncbi:OFA family MFS transporter [Nannocystis sp. ILAH1]|uniref:L-lactate MFS transporter n=1 Tax=unclassified Nannocystis TaxID=2627009 RepID=UPI002271EA08|nr:OFA family MFS transporter [Nannocystis sp. ILAH1]MCY1068371.1 OFA family MFS transporter [Nannocystis sp. RBIL2]
MRSRWTIPPAAVAIHLCVGSVYAWSVFNKPIEALHPAWPKGAAAYTFSIAIALLGLSAAFGGTWLERHGPKRAATLAACLFAGGLALGGLGVWLGWLWLLFVGYGVVGGAGLGLAYVSPVSALVKWFPDRRGLATGMAVLGFGGGALIAAPVKERLIQSVGVASTLWILAAVYFFVMMGAARALARPPDGWRPEGYVPKAIQLGGEPELTMPMAVRTRQFWLLWGMLFINISAGISILAQASPMMQDMFQRTPEQAAAMVSVIAGFNAFGRIFWASLSDRIGRRAVFSIFFAVQAALFVTIPQLAAGGQWQLFQLAVVVIFTMYGGGFATIPAFLADMFGARNVGAVHGVILTAWSAAGVAGPILITSIRESQLKALPPGGSRVELYASTLQIMAVALLVGLALTLAVRPLAPASARPA